MRCVNGSCREREEVGRTGRSSRWPCRGSFPPSGLQHDKRLALPSHSYPQRTCLLVASKRQTPGPAGRNLAKRRPQRGRAGLGRSQILFSREDAKGAKEEGGIGAEGGVHYTSEPLRAWRPVRLRSGQALARDIGACLSIIYVPHTQEFARENKISTSSNGGSGVFFLPCSAWRVITTAVGERESDVGRAGDVRPEQGRSRRVKSDGWENREKSRDLLIQKHAACLSRLMRTV